MSFAVDTSKPLPGPYRMPTDAERRTRIYLEKPYRDIPTVCEMNPDIQEHLDATMRLFVASPDMLAALRSLLHYVTCAPFEPRCYADAVAAAEAAIAKAEGKR